MKRNLSPYQIYETMDYDLFKAVFENRKTNQRNLINLAESLDICDLTPFKPILVDDDMNIIDGQHRFEKCKERGTPIYYMIIPIKDRRIIRNLQTQLPWDVQENLNYYVRCIDHNYISLKKFMDLHNYNLSTALAFMPESRHKNFYKEFRRGKFVFPDAITMDRIESLIIKIETIKKRLFDWRKLTTISLKAAALHHSLLIVISHPEVSYKTFMNKLELHLSMFHRCVTVGDYLEVFDDIYNYHNKGPYVNIASAKFEGAA